jgi:hypothetical protein
MQAEIRRIAPKDVKQNKNIDAEVLGYLRSAQRFSFCFVVNKDCKWFHGLAEARQAIDNSLVMMRHWKDADQQQDVIKRFEVLREDARANSFNVKLFGHMVLMNSLAAVTACLLVKHGAPEIIGWFPDRDKMTSSYKAIADELFSTNLSALCQSMSIDESRFKVAIGVPGPPDGVVAKGNWYDDLVRVPTTSPAQSRLGTSTKTIVPINSKRFWSRSSPIISISP